MKTDSFLATGGQIAVRLFELHGIDSRQFLREVGIDPSMMRDPKARIPSRFADVAFEKAAALIDDPAFALRAAECWHPSNLGVLGYAWLSSGTLRTGLKRIERYSHILGTKTTFRCKDESGWLHFSFDHGRRDAPIGPVMADYILSLILGMCRMNYGSTLNPVAVNLRRPAPEDQKPYRDFFGCDIHFGADEDSFVLGSRTVDMPLPSGNHELAVTFDTILADQMAALGEGDITTRCKGYLLTQLTSGEPSEQALANAMGMSLRTLQRKIGDLGTTYKRLLDETRYDLALKYLDDPQRSITEITFLLGFSEQSAFTRAFKRWSEKSPSSYRTEIPAHA